MRRAHKCLATCHLNFEIDSRYCSCRQRRCRQRGGIPSPCGSKNHGNLGKRRRAIQGDCDRQAEEDNVSCLSAQGLLAEQCCPWEQPRPLVRVGRHSPPVSSPIPGSVAAFFSPEAYCVTLHSTKPTSPLRVQGFCPGGLYARQRHQPQGPGGAGSSLIGTHRTAAERQLYTSKKCMYTSKKCMYTSNKCMYTS